jgi:homoserine O-acetyltransferase
MIHTKLHAISALALALFTTPALGEGDQQFAEFANCPLANGDVIESCRVGYRTFGAFNAERSNAVLFPTWFGGTSGDFVNYGYIGPGLFADSAEYFIISVDAFGNGVSSSPSNSESQPGSDFPEIAIEDMVDAQFRLLTEVLGIQHLHAVIGISMGGMQAFDWVVSYPDFVGKAVSVVGTPRQTSYDILLWSAQLEAIENLADDDYENTVRLVASIDNLVTFTPNYFAGNTPAVEFKEYFERSVESVRNRGLEDRVPQLRAMIAHDIFADFDGSMQLAAERISASLLIIVSPEDHMVNPIPSREFAEIAGAELIELPGDCGHIAVGCAKDEVTEAVLRFLSAP